MTYPAQNTSIFSTVTGNSTLNGTAHWKQYVFTPAGPDVKVTISVLIAVSSAIGFVGNLCVLRFTNNEEKKQARARSSSLNFFIRSLALSDVLCSFVGTPLLIMQINFDIFNNSKWPCIISRFFQFVFTIITAYNLVVIGVERYVCICYPRSRPLSLGAVKRGVKGAWIFGFLLSCVCIYPTEVVRVDLNNTHYTLACKYDYNYSSARVIRSVSGVLGYLLPTVILIFTCVCVMRKLWKRQPIGMPSSYHESESYRRWCAKRNKATKQLIAIIIAFIVPYFLFIGYVTFEALFNPSVDFKTDYTIRCVGVLLAYVNGSVNFVIHLVQLNGFYQTMKSYVLCCEREQSRGGRTVQTIPLKRVDPPCKPVTPQKAGGCRGRRQSMPPMCDVSRAENRDHHSRRESV